MIAIDRGIDWKALRPDSKSSWLTEVLQDDFESLLPMGGKAELGLFETFGLGVSTNRDTWAYNFQQSSLEKNMQATIDFYNESYLGGSEARTKISRLTISSSTKTAKSAGAGI